MKKQQGLTSTTNEWWPWTSRDKGTPPPTTSNQHPALPPMDGYEHHCAQHTTSTLHYYLWTATSTPGATLLSAMWQPNDNWQPNRHSLLMFRIGIYRGQLWLSGLWCVPGCSCAHSRVSTMNSQDRGSTCVESPYMHGMWLFSPHTKYVLNKFVYIYLRSYVSQHFRLSASVSHPSHIISCSL